MTSEMKLTGLAHLVILYYFRQRQNKNPNVKQKWLNKDLERKKEETFFIELANVIEDTGYHISLLANSIEEDVVDMERYGHQTIFVWDAQWTEASHTYISYFIQYSIYI